MSNNIFLALDVDSQQRAEELIHQTSNWVGGYKVGPRLLFSAGTEWVKSISNKHRVFLDLKFYDIPNTMLSSIRSSFELGVEFVTIHALAGPEALKQIKELEDELSKKRAFKVLAVTILTSYSEDTLPAVLKTSGVEKSVEALAGEVFKSGLRGIVCSGVEVKNLKTVYPDLYCVTPGVRLSNSSNSDQKRVVTPRQALDSGSDMLVVGRPIYEADDAEAAARQIFESVYEK
ncbi:MAG: orotidine-5'-phosphate decarboxylase [Bdellovibrionales bacterium]|nr:orotidine-5'-phosphate decarboxylase [Bdellovibrionales bacterium]